MNETAEKKSSREMKQIDFTEIKLEAFAVPASRG